MLDNHYLFPIHKDMCVCVYKRTWNVIRSKIHCKGIMFFPTPILEIRKKKRLENISNIETWCWGADFHYSPSSWGCLKIFMVGQTILQLNTWRCMRLSSIAHQWFDTSAHPPRWTLFNMVFLDCLIPRIATQKV